MSHIPVTIITGFLGSGKTTLLQRILHTYHGQKIAVIENEFGQENIDNDILVANSDEHIIQMNNGCICCSIREDLRTTLTELAEKNANGSLQFERVIIETTGMADPGPVAQTFFMDEVVAEQYLLDAIITLVDAKHAMQQLDDRIEAQRQIGFADHVLISKAELVTDSELAALQQRITKINPRATQRTAHFGETELEHILDLRGFNLNAHLDLQTEAKPAPTHKDEHEHHCGDCGGHHDAAHSCHDHAHEHKHDENCSHHNCSHNSHDDVTSFVFRTDKTFDAAKLEDFLSAIVNIYGPKMYRYKGVLNMQGTQRKVIFQGVHQLMGTDLGAEWAKDEARTSKMVFIGVELPREILQQGLQQCLI